VKVLDGDAVLRRDAASGLCLEALLGQQLQHPNIVRTMAWAVITGEVRTQQKSLHMLLLVLQLLRLAFGHVSGRTCCSRFVGVL
jgi:hypothetical protein